MVIEALFAAALLTCMENRLDCTVNHEKRIAVVCNFNPGERPIKSYGPFDIEFRGGVWTVVIIGECEDPV